MTMNSESMSSTIKIGDYVTLKHSTPTEGWLGAEGIITPDVLLCSDETTFENCLWEVHVQNQYTAVREYEEVVFSKMAEEPSGEGVGLIEDQYKRSENLVDQLHRAATNEGRLNEKLMAMKVGKPVSFGDVIQLRHVKSKKFLTVNAAVLAKSERENIRVSLEGYGDTMSWLEFMPRSKADKEGLPILSNSETYVRVHDRPSEFIHCARKVSKAHKTTEREINCSLETSCWTISVFQHAGDVVAGCILAGQLVTFLEPESSSFLSLDKTDVSRVILQQSNTMTSDQSQSSVGTNLLWVIEKARHHTGGRVGLRAEKWALRHLNTGLYARVDSKSILRTVDKREHCSYFELSASSQSHEDGVASGCLMDHSLVQLSSTGKWLHTPLLQTRQTIIKQSSGNESSPVASPAASSKWHGSTDSGAVSSSPSMADKSNLHEGRTCNLVRDRALGTYLTISNELQQTLGVDLFVGLEASKLLTSFESAARDGSLMMEPPAMVENTVKMLFTVLDILFQFLTDDLLDAAHHASQNKEDWRYDLMENRSNAKATGTRQTMMREQGVLSAIIGIIELCSDGVLLQLSNFTRRVRDAGQMKTPSLRALSRNFHSLQSMKSTVDQDSVVSPTMTSKKVLLSSAITTPGRPPPNRGHSMGKVGRLSQTRTASFSGHESAALVATSTRAHRAAAVDGSGSPLPNPLSFDESDSDENSIPDSKADSISPAEMEQDERAHNRSFFDDTDGTDTSPACLSPSGRANRSSYTMSSEILTACFRVLLAIIHDNHANQMFIADKFAVLLSQVKDQELAVVCVQEMLRDNLQMLQTKVWDCNDRVI